MNSQNNSIKTPLILLIVASIFVITCAFSAYNFFSFKKSAEERMQSELQAVSSRLAITLPPAIWNFENEQLKKIVRSESISDFVVAIDINDDKGKSIFNYQKDQNQSNDNASKDTKPDYTATIESTLIFDDNGSPQSVGTVTLYYDDAPIQHRLQETLVERLIFLVVLTVVTGLIITYILNVMLLNPIQDIISKLNRIVESGDLTYTFPTYQYELGKIVKEINFFIDGIKEIAKGISSNSSEVKSHLIKLSEDVSTTKDDIVLQQQETGDVFHVASEIKQKATSVATQASHLAEHVLEVNNNANSTTDMLLVAINSVTQYVEKMRDSANSMSQLQESVDNISNILEVIRGIADQTNLLALNAAIEAARAGEQGRGFAVVADEVRSLASKTQDSTEEIQRMIENLKSGTDQTMQYLAQGRDSSQETIDQTHAAQTGIHQIVKAIDEMSSMIQDIANASQEQSALNENIQQNLDTILQVANRSKTNSELVDSTISSVSNSVSGLSQSVSRFKV